MRQGKSVAWRRRQAAEVTRRLDIEYPTAHIALRFGSEWELTVAVILSAQATDRKVNEVTERLFRKYRSIEEYAAADPAEFEQDIHETGFFRNKTKHILGAAQRVLVGLRRRGAAHHGRAGDPPRCGTQDGQHRPGQRRPRGLRRPIPTPASRSTPTSSG